MRGRDSLSSEGEPARCGAEENVFNRVIVSFLGLWYPDGHALPRFLGLMLPLMKSAAERGPDRAQVRDAILILAVRN